MPFLFLPFAKPSMRNWKMIASIAVALGVFYAFRQIMVAGSESISLGTIVYGHLSNIVGSLRRLCGLAGIHDLLNGFSLLAVIATAGLVLDRGSATPRIPGFLLLIVPVAFAMALVSGNMGRMLFAAYVPVLACALLAIQHFCTPARARDLGELVSGDLASVSIRPSHI